jgi:hypothetical protein
MTPSLQTAQVLHGHGVACIPCNADKTPRIASWKPYKTTLPTPTELERWFSKDAKMALIAGKVQCLDFDEKYSRGILSRYAKRAEDCGLDHLVGSLIQQLTPTGGYHLVWQCDGPMVNNLKLAQKANLETLIETRGDGGYFLIAPSEGYKLLNGDWSSIPNITEDDRDALLNLARTFDERPPIEAHEPRQPTTGPLAGEATPGDDFDFRADMPALLKKHGWKPAGRDGKYWTRPGKSKGISASWDIVPGRFFVFSSSTQFEPNHVYRPWHVYAILECGGDYARAAGDLRRQGFGGVTAPKHTAQPLPDDWNPPMEMAPEDQTPGVEPTGDAPTHETEEEKIRRLLNARRFDPASKPPDLRVRFTMLGVVVATPGNIAAVTAQAKVGKSALMQAFTAATMTDSDDVDLLGVKGFNKDGYGVIYFDTEQSKDDFWRAIDRSKRRATTPDIPAWFSAYAVGDLPVGYQRKALSIRMADAKAQFGGIHSVIIDGVADMVLDVNDAEECNSFVAELFNLATRYDCSIICVIHKNPGSDKTRGHLGSQIERKAETNLTLEKEDDQTVVFSLKQRRAPIYKADGARFAWSEEAGMHVSVAASGRVKMTATMKEWQRHAMAAFGGGKPMKFTELSASLVRISGKSEATANRQIAKLLETGVLTYKGSLGEYTLTDPAQL